MGPIEVTLCPKFKEIAPDYESLFRPNDNEQTKERIKNLVTTLDEGREATEIHGKRVYYRERYKK